MCCNIQFILGALDFCTFVLYHCNLCYMNLHLKIFLRSLRWFWSFSLLFHEERCKYLVKIGCTEPSCFFFFFCSTSGLLGSCFTCVRLCEDLCNVWGRCSSYAVKNKTHTHWCSKVKC